MEPHAIKQSKAFARLCKLATNWTACICIAMVRACAI